MKEGLLQKRDSPSALGVGVYSGAKAGFTKRDKGGWGGVYRDVGAITLGVNTREASPPNTNIC